MQELKELWEKVLTKIQNMVSAISFDLWINTLEIIDFKDAKKLILGCASNSAKVQIQKNHYNQLKECIQTIFDEDVEFELLDKAEKEEYLKVNGTQIQEKVEDVKVEANSNIDEKYTFDNFVVGKSNQFVYTACKTVAENPGKTFNPLFIYGGPGLGKTHLLLATANFIKNTYKDLKVEYVTCEKFTNDYIDSLMAGKDKATSKFREKYRNLDVLMVDDIQFITNKVSTQEEFFHTFNDLYQNGKQIIIASDRPPKEIETLEERLRSRFSSGLIQDIQKPDIETRIAILRKKAQLERYFVNEDAIEFIASNCDKSVRDMEGMLNNVYFYATLTGKRVATIEDAKEVIKEEIEKQKDQLTSDVIINTVCEYFGIKREEILGKKRSKEIVEPRMISVYLIDELMDIPLINIGKIFGGRDHTTIMHSRDKINELMKYDNKTKTIVNEIKNKLK